MPVHYRRRIRSGQRQQLMTAQAARREMQQTLEQHAKTIKQEFEGFVSDWSKDNRPSFTIEKHVSDREIRVVVRPYQNRKASKIFGYVDKGTKPHVIRARKAKVLAFPWGGPGSYSAKTVPVAKAHVGSGQVVGGTQRFFKQVNHPGSKARLFSETVQDRTRPQLQRDIENLFRRLERKMNKR